MPGIISLGTRAMFAAQAQLNTTAANISNANTPGYSRQTVELETAGGQFTGAGFFGKGVNITTVSRAHDAFLSREVTLSQALAAHDAARLEQLQRVERVFDLGENGLGARVSAFLNAFVDVASDPNDPSARQVVLSRAQALTSQVRSVAAQLDSIQTGVTEDIKTSVDAANQLVQRIADLNQQIARVKGFGHEPNDLLDQREQLINELNHYIGVTQIPASDGTVGLFIGGGQKLLLGSNALELRALPDTYDSSRVVLGVHEGGVDRRLDDRVLGGGSIAGLLRFQREDLPVAINEVGRLAGVIAARVNAQHAAGTTPPPVAPGPPIFATGAPRALPASTNTGTAAVGVVIQDATLLSAKDLELTFRSGAWQVRELPDGSFTALSAAQLLSDHGLQLSFSGTAQEGDRFLLEPSRLVAASMGVVLNDPMRLAATSATESNGNAKAMLALRDERMVRGMTLADAYAGATASVGVRVMGAKAASEMSSSIAKDAEVRRNNVEGVNLDEEAARLIQFQQAYQAAAKVLQVAQSVFDTLLQTAAR